MLYNVIKCYIMLYNVMLYNVMECYITLYNVMLYNVMECFILGRPSNKSFFKILRSNNMILDSLYNLNTLIELFKVYF